MNKNVAGITKKKVLIIDDEDILRDVLTDVMEMIDIDSFSASGGHQGVEIYKKHKNEIGLVLLDLLMPDASGLETYQRLCYINPDVNVIFMSGIGDQNSLPKFSLDNGCVFVQKPFSMDEITTKVKCCLKTHYLNKSPNLH